MRLTGGKRIFFTWGLNAIFSPLSLAFFGFILYFCRNSTKKGF
jgi:hypothetical protein